MADFVPGNPTGYSLKVDRNDGVVVLLPDPLASQPKAGHWRVQATPRSRTEDMTRLAKANGWSPSERDARIAALIAVKGSDVYVPRTKKVRQVRGLRTATLTGCPLNSGKVEGDYLTDTVTRTLSLRQKVREAVAAGLIAAEDAPQWAREGTGA